jgi:hypothetical protein
MLLSAISLQDAHPLPDSKSKRDGALEMEWPFGDNGIISIYRIRRSQSFWSVKFKSAIFASKLSRNPGGGPRQALVRSDVE